MARDDLEREVDRNYDAFLSHLPSLLLQHRGQIALYRAGLAADFFEDMGSALDAGRARFLDGLFSVQEVTDRPADLGFFSHAVYPRIA